MSAEPVLSANSEPAKGLPPVAPPSGAFIVQLFLVPGIIVVVAVLILMGFSWLVGGTSSPETLLDRLESGNVDVRWRAANELAQTLQRDDRLAANPAVALRLAGLLRKAVEELDGTQQASTGSDRAKERQTLRTRRKDVQFLCSCLGRVSIPAGAPVLKDLALRKKGDVKTMVLLRRGAVWALANLGDNLKRFGKLSPEDVAEVRQGLQQAEARGGETGEWARLCLNYLDGAKQKIGVIEALAECAKTRGDPADDPYLRELVAQALAFWEGDPAENALADQTLLALARDDGHGVRVEIGEDD